MFSHVLPSLVLSRERRLSFLRKVSLSTSRKSCRFLLPARCYLGSWILILTAEQSTGNTQHASYVVQSNDLRFVCTAPYSLATAPPSTATSAVAATTTTEVGARDSSSSAGATPSSSPLPGFDPSAAHEFFRRHGLAGRVRSVFFSLQMAAPFLFVFYDMF